jgi:hypothetical protein
LGEKKKAIKKINAEVTEETQRAQRNRGYGETAEARIAGRSESRRAVILGRMTLQVQKQRQESKAGRKSAEAVFVDGHAYCGVHA